MKYVLLCLVALIGCIYIAHAQDASRNMRFLHDHDWNVCFTFIHNSSQPADLGLDSRAFCEKVSIIMDGSTCNGPFDGVSPVAKNGGPLFPGQSCEEVTCPEKTHYCSKGMVTSCCNKEYDAIKKELLSDKCPDGSKAGGITKTNPQTPVIVGKTCNDLICEEGQKCTQINKYFAKCCGAH